MNKQIIQREYHCASSNDRWILECIFPGKENGYFLEAGAANGKEVSSCYILEKEMGWTGICVEPNDYFFGKLVLNRPKSICEHVCLHSQQEKVTYIEGNNDTVSHYLSGIKSNLEAFKYGGEEVVKNGNPIEKDAVTLEYLLGKNNAPKIIDYAAFDIEGSELNVLKVFPFDTYTFLAISLECDGSILLPITQLLESNYYKRVDNPFNKDQPWDMYWLHKSICPT